MMPMLRYQVKSLKSEYQSNRNFMLNEVLKKIMTMMANPISRKIILQKAKKMYLEFKELVVFNIHKKWFLHSPFGGIFIVFSFSNLIQSYF